MADLRAPDPMLIGLHEPVAVDQQAPRPAVAHRLPAPGSALTRCWLTAVSKVNSGYAAWFAVPCRECFPDAPPPGHQWCGCPQFEGGEWHTHRAEGRAWQISSAEVGG